MPENKPLIGLTWEPKLPPLSSGTKTNGSEKLANLPQNTVWEPETELIHGLLVLPKDPNKSNKSMRKLVEETAGRSWFDMAAPTVTPEIKKDLQILKLRSVIDPKRHYKKGDLKSKVLPKYFQVGKVVDSASNFFSGRLTKKQSKVNLTDELLSDHSLWEYRKCKVQEIEQQNCVVGVEKWKIKGPIVEACKAKKAWIKNAYIFAEIYVHSC